MNEDNLRPDEAVAPIDGGRVPQVLVEYTGVRHGAVSYRGRVTRSVYRFDAGPLHKRNWVHLEDADHFAKFVDFRILEDTKIDPAEDRLRAIERRLAEEEANTARQRAETDRDQAVRQQEREAPAAEIMNSLAEQKRTPASPPGRPKGLGLDTRVRHLRDVENIQDYRQVLKQLKEDNWPGVNSLEDVALRRAYKRGRGPHADACPYGCKDPQSEKS